VPRDAERPLRIRLEHTRFPHWGGHSGYVAFARFLDRGRCDVTVHGASDGDDDLPLALAPLRPRLRRFVRRGGMPWYKLSDLAAEVRAFGACLAGRAEVVHLLDGEHSGQYLPALLRRARISSVRVIATFHQPPGIAGDLLDPDLVARLDQVVLVSPSQRSFFLDHVEPERLHVILHGVDTDFFRPREAARPPGHRFRCVTVGHWLRDWLVFRAVAAALPETDFEVVAGRELWLDDLPNVRVRRGLDDDELARLYREADVLFLPLLDSTANNALLEGMASGLPVVTTRLQSTRAYMPGPEGILVAPGSVDAAVEALSRMQRDPALRQAAGRAARARAQELAWCKLASRYEDLYLSAIRQPPAPFRR
jgi:glycosyltransferase involved in cell wall biosynthesis